MNKLTKTINKRRKNYKPTIGLLTETGRKVSINANIFYIEKALQEKLEAERVARKFAHDFLREKCPDLFKFMELLGGMGSWMYY